MDTYFPALKNNNLELYRLRGDGSCPFCSGSQVWADNCRVCAVETDDYRLYCLSQAQSTLIQQSHLSLIYESHSLSSHTPLYHTSYAHMLAFGFFFSSLPHVLHCWVSTSCHLTVHWKERIEPLQVPPLRRIRLFMMRMALWLPLRILTNVWIRGRGKAGSSLQPGNYCFGSNNLCRQMITSTNSQISGFDLLRSSTAECSFHLVVILRTSRVKSPAHSEVASLGRGRQFFKFKRNVYFPPSYSQTTKCQPMLVPRWFANFVRWHSAISIMLKLQRCAVNIVGHSSSEKINEWRSY